MENKEFNLFGSNWKLQFKDKVEDNGRWIYGAASGIKKLCEVSLKDDDGIPLPDEEIEIAKLHEIMHAIFKSGQYLSCDDDEPLVEWCARCIFTLKKQGII